MDVESPFTKRFRGENGAAEERINVSPSPVVHLRQLHPNATEGQILEAMQRFGRVSYVVNIQPRRMALVEFEDQASASRCIEQSKNVAIGGSTALANYSTSKSLNRKGLASDVPNKVLVLFIKNARYPVNVEVIHTICKPHGFVARISISGRSEGIQVLVEFDSIEAAKAAKYALNGADIYPGCNTIKAEYSKIERVNVQANNEDHWDFTAPKENMSSDGPPRQQEMNKSLLSGPPPSIMGGSGMGLGMKNPTPMGMGAGGPFGGPGPEEGYGAYGQSFYGGPTAGGWAAPGRTPGQDFGAGGQPAVMSPPYGDMRQDIGFSGSIPVMLYGVDQQNWTPQRVFNLLCLYGNVGKVKFLKSKPDTVMVEMGSVEQMNQAANCLNGQEVFGSEIAVRRSKQDSLGTPREGFELANGASGFRDFSTEAKNQRFATPEAAAKNQVMAPTTALHFYNAPKTITEERLIAILRENEADAPTSVTIIKSERSSRGYLNFADDKTATEALIKTNHASIPSDGGRTPFTFKLAFTRPTRRDPKSD